MYIYIRCQIQIDKSRTSVVREAGVSRHNVGIIVGTSPPSHSTINDPDTIVPLCSWDP